MKDTVVPHHTENAATGAEALETNVSEIFLTTDGRIRCFGLSRELLSLLCESGLADDTLYQRYKQCNITTSH